MQCCGEACKWRLTFGEAGCDVIDGRGLRHGYFEWRILDQLRIVSASHDVFQVLDWINQLLSLAIAPAKASPSGYLQYHDAPKYCIHQAQEYLDLKTNKRHD
jgi:hypothetical protein